MQNNNTKHENLLLDILQSIIDNKKKFFFNFFTILTVLLIINFFNEKNKKISVIIEKNIFFTNIYDALKPFHDFQIYNKLESFNNIYKSLNYSYKDLNEEINSNTSFLKKKIVDNIDKTSLSEKVIKEQLRYYLTSSLVNNLQNEIGNITNKKNEYDDYYVLRYDLKDLSKLEDVTKKINQIITKVGFEHYSNVLDKAKLLVKEYYQINKNSFQSELESQLNEINNYIEMIKIKNEIKYSSIELLEKALTDNKENRKSILDNILIIRNGDGFEKKGGFIFNEFNQDIKLITYSNVNDVSKLENIAFNAKKILNNLKIMDPQSDLYKKIIDSFALTETYISNLNNQIVELKKISSQNLFDQNKIGSEYHKIVTQHNFRHSIFSYISVIIISLVLTIFIFVLKNKLKY